jgi:hypothetical protein
LTHFNFTELFFKSDESLSRIFKKHRKTGIIFTRVALERLATRVHAFSILPAALPGPATLPGSLVRQPCPAALPGSLARQPCSAALPGSLA